MNKRKIEESIRQSIALDTPDLFDKIASTPVQKLAEEDYIVKERPKRNTSRLHLLYTACTSLALLFAICFGLAHNYYSVDSIGSGRKMRGSIARTLRMMGWKSIWSRISRCRSTPGAISFSSTPSGVRAKTARSVT